MLNRGSRGKSGAIKDKTWTIRDNLCFVPSFPCFVPPGPCFVPAYLCFVPACPCFVHACLCFVEIFGDLEQQGLKTVHWLCHNFPPLDFVCILYHVQSFTDIDTFCHNFSSLWLKSTTYTEFL